MREVYSKRTVKVQAVDRFDRSDDITGQPLINGDIGSPYLRQPEVFRSDINLAGDFCLYGCRIGTVKVHITFEAFPLRISASSPIISLISVEAAGHPVGVNVVEDQDKRKTSGEDFCTDTYQVCSVIRDYTDDYI